MKFQFKLSTVLLSATSIVLAVSLAFTGVIIYKKNAYIKDIKAQITKNESQILELEKQTQELEKNLENSNNEKEKVSSELESAKSEKDKLKKENSKLKSQIEKLKAEKAEKAKAAVNNAASPTPAPNITPPPANKVCYLTFDDGPSHNTLKILDILNRYGIKATFFVINTSDIAYVKNIYDAGHTVGLHSASHTYSDIYRSTDAFFADLDKISGIVESIIGVKPNITRFPGGSSNTVSKHYCKGIMSSLSKMVPERGYHYFDWNVSSQDASGNKVSYTKIVNSVLNAADGKNSICVLMHDSAEKTTTVDALPFIIDGLIAKGFSFAPLTEQSYGYHHGVNN